MKYMIPIFRYEIYNLLRSKWLITLGILFVMFEILLLHLGGHPGKIIIGLMNLTLLILPLIGLVVAVIHFYSSREFIELLLCQPIQRTTIYLAKSLSLSCAISIILAISFILPICWYRIQLGEYFPTFLLTIGSGIILVLIFNQLGFLIASICEDKLKGIGLALVLWITFVFLYDAGLLFLIYMLQEYAFEKTLIAFIIFNPIDLCRILILLQLDIAALMGYTGAIFKTFLGSFEGTLWIALSLLFWITIPIGLGIFCFKRKDL